MPLQPPSSQLDEINLGLVLKIMLISGLISVGIKFLGPQLAIPATSAIALAMVLLPSLVLGIALLWRGWQQS